MPRFGETVRINKDLFIIRDAKTMIGKHGKVFNRPLDQYLTKVEVPLRVLLEKLKVTEAQLRAVLNYKPFKPMDSKGTRKKGNSYRKTIYKEPKISKKGLHG